MHWNYFLFKILVLILSKVLIDAPPPPPLSPSSSSSIYSHAFFFCSTLASAHKSPWLPRKCGNHWSVFFFFFFHFLGVCVWWCPRIHKVRIFMRPNSWEFCKANMVWRICRHFATKCVLKHDLCYYILYCIFFFFNMILVLSLSMACSSCTWASYLVFVLGLESLPMRQRVYCLY